MIVMLNGIGRIKMVNKIFRIEYEDVDKKGYSIIRAGYFIKVGPRYFQIFPGDSHLEVNEKKVVLNEEVEMNCFGEFRKVNYV